MNSAEFRKSLERGLSNHKYLNLVRLIGAEEAIKLDNPVYDVLKLKEEILKGKIIKPFCLPVPSNVVVALLLKVSQPYRLFKYFGMEPPTGLELNLEKLNSLFYINTWSNLPGNLAVIRDKQLDLLNLSNDIGISITLLRTLINKVSIRSGLQEQVLFFDSHTKCIVRSNSFLHAHTLSSARDIEEAPTHFIDAYIYLGGFRCEYLGDDLFSSSERTNTIVAVLKNIEQSGIPIPNRIKVPELCSIFKASDDGHSLHFKDKGRSIHIRALMSKLELPEETVLALLKSVTNVKITVYENLIIVLDRLKAIN